METTDNSANSTVPMGFSVSDAAEVIEKASDSLALLEATICGLMNAGDGLTPAEAHGALILLSGVQADLDDVKTALARHATPAAA